MTETQAMTLLAEANPIQVEDLAPLSTPDLSRHFPSNRHVLAFAAVVSAVAASLIGFFVVPSTSPQPPATTTVPTAGGAPASPIPLDQALRIASSSFGVAVTLPDTPLLKPSDAQQTGFVQWLPAQEPGEQEPVSQLDVQFPPQGTTATPFVTIEYVPTAYAVCWNGSGDVSCSSVYPNALDQYKAEIAQTPTQPVDGRTPPTYQIVYLSDGTPALIATDSGGNDIKFRLGPLSISIGAPSNDGVPTTVDAADLQALAQSIVDQTANQ